MRGTRHVAIGIITIILTTGYFTPRCRAGEPCAETTISAGAGNPADSTYVPQEATWLPMLQFDLQRTGAGENFPLDMIDIASSGSGNELTDVTSVALFLSDDTTFDAGVDTLEGMGTFAADDGTTSVGFSVPITVTDTVKHLFLAYQFASTTPKGATFQASVPLNSSVIPLFCSPNNVTGAPITGGTITTTFGDASVALGQANPADGKTFAGDAGVPMLQIAITADAAEGLDLESITITDAIAAAHPALISAVRAWYDADADGTISSGDIELGSEKTFTAGVETLTLSSLGHVVAAGATDHILLTYDFAETAQQLARIRSWQLKAWATRIAKGLIQAPFALAGCGGSAPSGTDLEEEQEQALSLSGAPEGTHFTDLEGNAIDQAETGDAVQLRTVGGTKVLQFTMGTSAVDLQETLLEIDAHGIFISLPPPEASASAAVTGLAGELTLFVPCDDDDTLVHICPEEEAMPEGLPLCAAGTLFSAEASTNSAYRWENAGVRTGTEACTIVGAADAFQAFYASGKTSTGLTFQASIDDAASIVTTGSLSGKDFEPSGSPMQGAARALIGQ